MHNQLGSLKPASGTQHASLLLLSFIHGPTQTKAMHHWVCYRLLLRPNGLMKLVVPEDPDPLTPGSAFHAVEATAAAWKEPLLST